jgi:glycosyltransferase involved in cell wall biosynthesis
VKKISIVVPTFNEEENIGELVKQTQAVLKENLGQYDYEIIIIDNDSKDSTRDIVRLMCHKNSKIKAVFNARNFGFFNSQYYGLLQATGDCTVMLCADFQDPVELIPQFVDEWEKGSKIVCGIKTSSDESKIMYFIRSIYYRLIKKTSEIDQISNFTGFALYDREIVTIMKSLEDPMPFLRGIIAEIGYDRKDIEYNQLKRRAGKTSFNFYRLYDAAMLSFTSYTKIGLRLATFTGFFAAGLSALIGLVYLIYKILNWNAFSTGMAPLIIGMFFLGSLQLIFIGLLGEYILSINRRLMNRPLVIEKERINFTNDK